MAFDASLAISISVVGIVITFALVTIINILTGRSKDKEKNHHQSPLTG